MSRNEHNAKQFRSSHHIYTVIREVGRGGNATVYECQVDESSKRIAVKELRRAQQRDSLARFRDEIAFVKKWVESGESGVLPIVDIGDNYAWYAMPIAEPVIRYLEVNAGRNVEDRVNLVVKGVLQLAKTLARIHAKGISHRDIKPSNVVVVNDEFLLADFGLVSLHTGHVNITRANKKLGPMFSIAPEMLRNPKTANGAKADIYSLGKTLWMLLMDDEKGFDGQYSWEDESHMLHGNEELRGVHLVAIEELIHSSTDNDPEKRPDAAEFAKRLESHISAIESVYDAQYREWGFLQKRLFPFGVPRQVIYDNVESIITTLNALRGQALYNHMLFPDGGGLDFIEAKKALEAGCISLRCDYGVSVLKPKVLYVEHFNDIKWNYLRLEADILEPVGDIKEGNFAQELMAVDDGSYVSARYAIYGVRDYDTGEPLPKGAICVRRYVKGSFLIVPKMGPYNSICSVYDARHNQFSSSDFRTYINTMASIVAELEKKGYNWRQIDVGKLFGSNPFSVQCRDNIPVSADDFIRDNYRSFDFSDLIENVVEHEDGLCEYWIVFCDGFGDVCNSKIEMIVCRNGHLSDSLSFDAKEIFRTRSRDLAVALRDRLETRLESICKSKGMTVISCQFEIHWRRVGKPHHLFGKDELRALIMEADDRRNNRLVVDEFGMLRMVNGFYPAGLFPVEFETFAAGGKYVGKYAVWSEEEFDEYYTTALHYWRLHLKTNQHQSVAYVMHFEEDETISGSESSDTVK